MKRLLLLILLLPLFSNAQVRTSTGPGDFYNPLMWSPIGIPTNGDSLVINHAMSMNTDIYYTHGQILINASGSLTESIIDRAVWVDGGSLINHGTFTSHHLVVSNWGEIENTGSLVGIDSMLNQATITNTGTIGVYDYAVDYTGTHTNIGSMDVTNNFHNQGVITNVGAITTANDFSNCNTQIGQALFINDGIFCVGNDFLNCGMDQIAGFGNYFVGNLASNLGSFVGTHTFHTPSGTLVLSGDVSPSVTITTGSCNVGVDEVESLNYEMYPNPAFDVVYLSLNDKDYSIYDNAGKCVKSGRIKGGTINLNDLNTGIYFLAIERAKMKKIVKN